MLGAIAGDIIGSPYEFRNIRKTDFELFNHDSRFTDDTILTIAIADSILNNKDYALTLKEYGRRYSYGDYGVSFSKWLNSDSLDPYNSFGNGSAMRASPIGFAFDTIEKVREEARRSAEVTHNHPEGIKGAEAVASAIFLARKSYEKDQIKDYIEDNFGYVLDESLDDIRQYYTFNETCQGTVPQAITAFLESENYEDAIRKAVSIGGDSDTVACITGGIAHAHYKKIPAVIVDEVKERLPIELLEVVNKFCDTYKINC